MFEGVETTAVRKFKSTDTLWSELGMWNRYERYASASSPLLPIRVLWCSSCFLVFLTCALLMTSSHSKPKVQRDAQA